MKISELIKKLKSLEKNYGGDVTVLIHTESIDTEFTIPMIIDGVFYEGGRHKDSIAISANIKECKA